MVEPTWTFDSKLQRLDKKLEENYTSINNKIDKNLTTFTSAIQNIKSDIIKEITSKVDDVKILKESINDRVNSFNHNLIEKIENQNQKINQRDVITLNSINALQKKLNTLHFDIIDNEDNISVTYVNPDGKIEYGAIRKFVPDGKTITTDKDKKISLKYTFDKVDLPIIDNKLYVKSMTLSNGKHLSSDKINNDLNNATNNIQILNKKVASILDRLHTFNGYISSNNFRKDKPTEDQLYDFAIKCFNDNNITKEKIPSGTKIKNTYDNHVWILNRVVVDGLTISKWEDFGSDNICIASNDGIHGLVAGSHERYMGFIDLQGRISINGLQEDMEEILKSLQNINNDFIRIQTEISAKLDRFEDRINKLEA